MQKRIVCALILLTSFATTYARQLPVLRSNSSAVSIRDGNILKPHYWHLDPKTNPDIYYADVPRKNNTISFITDTDSLSVPVKYGEEFDFVILLNNRDSCFTRISARLHGVFNPSAHSAPSPDTIPFTLKESRIMLKGRVNDRENITIQFDLGAGTSCVNIRAVSKAGIKFDGTTNVSNTSGVRAEPSSTHNKLQLGTLTWEQIPVVQVRNMEDYEDMIIGNSLFRDKVVEINYDKQILIVHHSPIPIPAGYSSYEVLYDQHRPKIKIDLDIAGQTFTDWFLFDTGRDGTMLIGDDFTGKFNVWKKFNSIFKIGTKKIVIIPRVKIGGLTFPDVVTNANDPAHPNGKQSLVGNELLNQFNLILDNQQGMLYLRPNTRQDGHYANWAGFRVKFYGAIAGIVIILGFTGWLIYRRIKKRPPQNSF